MGDAMRRDRVIAINTEHDGVSRTVKAQYFKTSVANFLYINDWGATGAMVIYET